MQFLNPVTQQVFDRCTPETASFLSSLAMVAPPANAPATDPIFYVSEMPAMPAGVKPKFRWLEANFDERTEARINEWRANFEKINKRVYEADAKPEIHLTILFGHCPTAVDAKKAIFERMPRHALTFGYVKALGRAGHEDCWVAVVDDDRLMAWMQSARDDAALNCKHAKYEVHGNWPAEKDEYPGPPIPHATLIRNVKDINMNAPVPALGCLAPANFEGAYLVGGTEFASFEVLGNDNKPLKIKLAMVYKTE